VKNKNKLFLQAALEYIVSVMNSSYPAGLTERRQKILQVLRESLELRGYSPSLREIADAVGLKTVSAVAYQLKILAEMGYVARDPRLARTVVEQSPRLGGITGASSPEIVSMPLFDRIAAGTGVIADPEPVGTLQLPRSQVGSGNLFAVTVTGDSMIGANIFDGDVVIVRRQEVAHDGDIVAALIEGEEATVKTFQRAGGHVWLIPQNPRYDPIPGDDCRIMGKVVSTLHRL
jgi:repressor LexA